MTNWLSHRNLGFPAPAGGHVRGAAAVLVAAMFLASAGGVSAQSTQAPRVGTTVVVPNASVNRTPQADISIMRGQQTLQSRQLQQQRLTNDVQRSIDNANRVRIPRVD
ncbi:hypothetical protein [Microbaculum marinum]|uniref:Uncharacterized protein n=1 Tax=Microbaculum marinum TaxID=1764581 RepID=A0AAW9RXP3_9HYPH